MISYSKPFAHWNYLPNTDATPPIVELVSAPLAYHPSGDGKTSLMYLIIAHATLSREFSSAVSLGGHEAAVVLFDPLHHFSVPRLAQTLLQLIVSKIGADIDQATKSDIRSIVARSLLHVHIFRPQSWPSLLTTLRTLPDYLFDKSRHKSIHRRVHSIIMDDIDAFVWSIRNSKPPDPAATSNTALATASTNLTSTLQQLNTLLSCATILTSQSTSPSSFRPALPISWPQGLTVTRLAVRRVEVLKFAPAISVEEAEAEKAKRWEVVQTGRFECFKVGVGVGVNEGFVFRAAQGGVDVEETQEK
ncbi:hypothetical protein FB567DRAFT_605697 [Paraphoma chrysanthemicola]|uniref:Uncharacterized protein n=1 Tax=Paraphoma chrysanthemicola TaxID=798071 RepID=A0A8K0R0X8_9PLEO|nr:hypothetical protein FB567DRAFT_605697 [Paraphoma chrysanthemicola]